MCDQSNIKKSKKENNFKRESKQNNNKNQKTNIKTEKR